MERGMTKFRIHLTIDGVIEPEVLEEPKGFRLPLDDKFARELKLARVARGLTLSGLSDLSGVSISHIGRLERVERVPGRRIIEKLQEGLGKAKTV